MNYWTKQKEFKKGHFDVKVSTSPEFMPVGDLFDDTVFNIKEMEQKIDRGDAVWFQTKAEFFFDGHLMGSGYTGGFYYEGKYEDELIEEGLDGCLEDIIYEAECEAITNVASLQKKINETFPA